MLLVANRYVLEAFQIMFMWCVYCHEIKLFLIWLRK